MIIERVTRILREELNSIESELISNYNRLGMKASGKWVNELAIDIKVLTGSLITAAIQAPEYTEFMIHGRGPTKKKGSGSGPNLTDRIEEWIKEKSTFRIIEKEISIRSLAFIIARKIHESGTKYYREGGTKLVSSVITTDRIVSVFNRINEEIATIVADQTRIEFEKMAS